MNQNKLDYFNSVIKNEFPLLVQILEKNILFGHWGFKLRSSGVFQKFPPSLIYDSEFCRVRFMWLAPDPRDKFIKSIYISYGRLHAPDDERIMMWNGEDCYCWHSVDLAVNFLDGISPSNIDITYKPKIMKQYFQPEILKYLGLEKLDYAEVPIELISKMHSNIWDVYGERLFELLDLRRPALWDKYVNFIKEFYSIKGVIPGMSPSPINIC